MAIRKRESALSKREQKMLEVVQNRKDHCDTQIKRFNKERDFDSSKDWLIRSCECDEILRELKSIRSCAKREYE